METRFDSSDLDTQMAELDDALGDSLNALNGQFADLVDFRGAEPALGLQNRKPKAEVPVAEADLAPRVLAKLIDVAIGGALSWIVALPFYGWFVGLLIGGMVGAAYVLLSDAMNGPRRRSFGKKWLDLRVERYDGQPITAQTSVRRNGVFAGLFLAQAFSIVAPTLAALLLLATIGGIGYEFHTLFYDYEGRRWGDVWAGTDVLQPVAARSKKTGAPRTRMPA